MIGEWESKPDTLAQGQLRLFKDYVKIVTTTKVIISKQSISSVEEMLPEKKFIRCHRSYIISVEKIKSFTNELIEIGTAEIPIGKLYRNEVVRLLE